MFKEKLYSGTLASITETAYVKRLPASSQISCNVTKTDLLNNSVKDFLLNECGLSSSDVVYYPMEGSADERKGNLFLFGTPVQLVIAGSTVYWNLYAGNIQIDNAGSSTTTDIFNGNNYNFKICLIGNPNTGFSLFISRYSLVYASYSACAFALYKLKDLPNEDYWTLITNISSSSISGSTIRSAITKCSDSTRLSVTSLYFTSNGNFTNGDAYLAFPNKYPLVPKVIGQLFEVMGGYEYALATVLSGSTSTPTTSYFYKIGNDNYCLLTSNHGILVKL